mgnify:CR=1 FL=1
MSGRSKKYQDEKIAGTELDEADEILTGEETAEEETKPEVSAPEEKISSLEKEIFEYRDKLVRKAAEFENYRKRTSEEYVRLINTAGEDIILKLLPVIDDIERFQKNYSDAIRPEDLKKGVDLIFEKLYTVLKNAGLSEIEALNTQFDPDLHDALLMVENKDVEPNTVVDQHEKGYRLNDKVIRHSKVIVSQ